MEKSKTMFIKDDINFLENPNWVISKRDFVNQLFIQKDTGFYELKSSEGLPTRFDKLVLYYLLHKLSPKDNMDLIQVITTRYEIAKNVFFQEKNFSKAKYDRIMLALKRWKAITIRFEGIFFEEFNNFSIKYFAVIDSVSLDKQTNKLSIGFNELYVKQLQETKFYTCINYEEYKKLTRPVSTRLYEILKKKFLIEAMWFISIDCLAELLTLRKRSYPSQILVALNPAIEEINNQSNLKVEFNYNKEAGICTFKKIEVRLACKVPSLQ